MLITSSLRRIPSLRSHHRLLSSSAPTPGKPSLLIRIWNAYADSLKKRPLPTKCSAAALIFFTSDSMAQYLMREGKEFQWNVWRATSGAIFGIVATSYLHFWWNGLEIVCERIMPSARSKIAHVAVKVLIDQGMGAPMYVYSYYTITNFLQTVAEDNKSPQEAWTECRNKANEMLWPTMFRHWQLWPIVHSFNFYYVPLHHRVLVQNLVLVGWSGYLSHLNNGGLLTPEKEVEVTVEIKRRETVEIKRRETVRQQEELARKEQTK